MDLAIETADFVVVATITGRLSFEAVIDALKLVSDGAAERDLDCILIDGSGVEGSLSIPDGYMLGLTLARYCLDRRRFQKVAVIGKDTSGLEFAAKVGWNRNLCAGWFTDRQAALNWLRAFAQSRFNNSPGKQSRHATPLAGSGAAGAGLAA